MSICPKPAPRSPDGGIHPDEEPQQAVLREVAEETGLLTASVVQQIIVEDKPRSDTRRPRRTIYFHLQALATTADAWNHRVCGDGDDMGLMFACRFLPLPAATTETTAGRRPRPMAGPYRSGLDDPDPQPRILIDVGGEISSSPTENACPALPAASAWATAGISW